MLFRSGIPKEIVTKIHTELAKILSRPDVQQRMADIGCDVAVSSPEEFGAFIKQQISYWGAKIKAAGIQPQ